MKYKLYLSMMLAASLSCGNTLSVFAQATESNTKVNLTVVNSDTEPKPVAVEVPSELNLKMDETGKIDVVNDMYIKNLSDETNIEVSELSVEGVNGWSVSDYQDDLSAEEDGTKKLSMEFNGDGTTSTGKVNLSEDNWTIKKSSKLPLNVNVKMPKQTEQSKTNIAVINYTFDTTTDTPSIPPEEDDESILSNNWDNSTKMLPGSSKEVKFNWDSTKADTHIVSIESSNPEIAEISEASTFASLDYNGEKSYTVEGVGRGTTTITATLDTGETSSFTVNVYELAGGDSGENIEIEVPGTDLQPGDNTSDSDITIEIPVTNPDGSDDVITVKPEIPSTDLEEGRNEIEVTVDVNGVTVNIIIVINITSPAEENPSNGLQQSVEEAQAMGFTFSAYEDGLQIDSFENKMFKREINVPEQIGEFKVRSIGDNAFKNQSNLTKITLPETLTKIGDYAFDGCSLVNGGNYQLPLLKSIGIDAFQGWSNLYIELPGDIQMTGSKRVQGRDCRVTAFENTNNVTVKFLDGTTSLPTAFFGARGIYDGLQTGSDGTEIAESLENLTIYLPASFEGFYVDPDYDYDSGGLIIGNFDFRSPFSELNRNTIIHIEQEMDQTLDWHNYLDYFFDVNWKGEYDGSYSFTNDFDSSNTLLKGQSKVVTFNWKSTDNLKQITEIKSSNPDVVSVEDVQQYSSDVISGSKQYTLNCLNSGTASITAKLNNGVETSFDVKVWETDGFDAETNTLEVELTSSLYNIGDTLNSNSLDIYIPIRCENETKYANLKDIVITDGTVINAGNNTITGTCTLSGILTNLKITLNKPAEEGVFSVKKLSNDTLSIVSFSGSETDLEIPEYMNGLPVSQIGDSAFESNTVLESVILPDSIKDIDDWAFYGCKALSEIKFSSNLNTIGDYAFDDCKGITSIELPESVTSIGLAAFSNCDSLRNVTLPNSLEFIGKYAFSNTSIIDITVPSSVTTLENSVFYRCESLESAEILCNLNDLPESTFRYCLSLKSVSLPSSIQTIGEYAFEQCKSLESIILPENLRTLKDNAFDECSNLSSVQLPNSVTSIGENAFSSCKMLTSIVIPNGITSIKSYTFDGCSSLNSVIIPNSVKSIKKAAFQGCKSLASITIPNSITSIESYAFNNCTGLNNLVIPNSVKTIGANAFNKVPHITYTGTASGKPWGAVTIN